MIVAITGFRVLENPPRTMCCIRLVIGEEATYCTPSAPCWERLEGAEFIDE